MNIIYAFFGLNRFTNFNSNIAEINEKQQKKNNRLTKINYKFNAVLLLTSATTKLVYFDHKFNSIAFNTKIQTD